MFRCENCVSVGQTIGLRLADSPVGQTIELRRLSAGPVGQTIEVRRLSAGPVGQTIEVRRLSAGPERTGDRRRKPIAGPTLFYKDTTMRTILFTLLCTMTLFAADPPRRAPGFSLPDLKGIQHDLADYHGKVVILEFTQTNCPHCAAFTEILDKVKPKFGAKVEILAITDPPDDQQKVAAYIAGHNITYPVLFDCGQVAYSYLRVVQFAQPQVYIIDSNGTIQRHYEYSAFTRDIFEGNGLLPEIERVLAASAPTKK
jgi:peroxiredoxin